MTRFGRKRPYESSRGNYHHRKGDIWGSNEDYSAQAGYGYGIDDTATSSATEHSAPREQTFPSELVAYLRNIVETSDGNFGLSRTFFPTKITPTRESSTAKHAQKRSICYAAWEYTFSAFSLIRWTFCLKSEIFIWKISNLRYKWHKPAWTLKTLA